MTTLLQQAAFSERLTHVLEAGERVAARSGEPALVSATVRVPYVDPAELFGRAKAEEERVFWEQPGERFSLVALGAVARLNGRGEGRFPQVTSAWRRLMSRAVTDVADAAPVAAPVCLGGFAFDPARRHEPHWQGYPDALLLVPRFLFTSHGGSSWLTVSALATPGCDARAAADAAADDLRGLLAGHVEMDDGERLGSEVAPADAAGVGRWKEAVAAVVQDVRRGTIEKLVLARRLRARALGPVEPDPVIRKLRAGYGNCTVFAFARGGSCFLGATPERLVRLEEGIVRADCLAGSTARGDSEGEDRALGEDLLADEKERHEHALVVRALREALGPLCSRLSVPATPDLLRMPNLQHLHTPVEGVVDGERHVLDLVERLHPTPAAGGLPRQAALPLIRSYETFDRGWYAGPVGWVDGRGGGEFVVAIRSALLRGNEALLYAGCGIVAGSDPEREYEESCLKLRPILWALNGKQT